MTRFLQVSSFFASFAILSGCELDYNFSVKSANYYLPLSLRTTDKSLATVGQIVAPNLPSKPSQPANKIPPLLGNKNLCAQDSELSLNELQEKQNILERLSDIENRLENKGARVLFAGEQNTFKETPECSPFLEIAKSIDVLLGGKTQPPATPQPNPSPLAQQIVSVNVEDSAKTLVLGLSNGKKVELNVGKALRQSGELPESGFVAPSETGQGIGVKFERTADNTTYSSYQDEGSCTFTIEKKICIDNECKVVSISEPGTRTNTINNTNYKYNYNMAFTTSTGQEAAELDVFVTAFSSYTNYGTCRKLYP